MIVSGVHSSCSRGVHPEAISVLSQRKHIRDCFAPLAMTNGGSIGAGQRKGEPCPQGRHPGCPYNSGLAYRGRRIMTTSKRKKSYIEVPYVDNTGGLNSKASVGS